MNRTWRKIALAAFTCIALSSTGSLADVPISELELGVSGSAFQEKMAAQNAIFLVVNDTFIHARKLAKLPNAQPGFQDYTQFSPSTEIKASICNGKVFKIEFTSIYKENFGAVMMARKSIYEYLVRGAAELTEIKFHQDENISDVSETFVINRDALSGSQRGQELVTFALLENGGEQFDWITLKLMLENKWHCPG